MFRYVQMIAECGSITTAAKRLFISQPALTKQIAKLENELGAKLFERKGTAPLHVTEEGDIFLTFANEYIEIEKQFVQRINQLNSSGTELIRIGSTPRGGDYAGNHAVAFLQECPRVNLDILDMNCHVCEESILDETVDLAIYTDPVLSDKIEYMPLERDPLVLVIPNKIMALMGIEPVKCSLDNPIKIDAECLRIPGVNFVLSTPNHSLYYAECDFLKKYKIRLDNPLRVDYVDTRYSIAAGGGGIMITPLTTPKRHETNAEVSFCTIKDEPLYRYVIIAKKKGRKLSKSAELYWKYTVENRFHS